MEASFGSYATGGDESHESFETSGGHSSSHLEQLVPCLNLSTIAGNVQLMVTPAITPLSPIYNEHFMVGRAPVYS